MSTAAAAARLLQLCPTLCDPIDGSPPGPAVPGILQARTLEPGDLPDPGIEPASLNVSCKTAKASRKQSSLSGKESAQGCLPKRLLGRPD